MNFEEALAEYGRLRQAYNSGQLNAQDFAQRVQQIQVRDASGTYWAIDGATGGWLRYDGSSWVPGQPPIAQQPGGMAAAQMGGSYGQQPAGGFGQTPAGGFGAPQGQGGFGAQPQGGFGASPQPQYGVPQQPVAPAQPARGRRGLLIGCLAAIGVLLVFCVAGIAIAAATGNSTFSIGGTSGLTEAATAKTVTNDKRPDQKATEFKTGDEMYITYKANRVKAGQYVDLKMYRNGTQVTLQDTKTAFEKDATYYGYYSYKPSQTGEYKVELYYNGQTTPSQTVSFTVK